jgi:hypothetical protein
MHSASLPAAHDISILSRAHDACFQQTPRPLHAVNMRTSHLVRSIRWHRRSSCTQSRVTTASACCVAARLRTTEARAIAEGVSQR